MRITKMITKQESNKEAEAILTSAKRIYTTIYQEDGGYPARGGFYLRVWPGYWVHEADLYRRKRGIIKEYPLYPDSRVLKSRFKKHGIEVYE